VDKEDGRPVAHAQTLVEEEELLALIRTFGDNEPPTLATTGIVARNGR
jgi:hypothetical protein